MAGLRPIGANLSGLADGLPQCVITGLDPVTRDFAAHGTASRGWPAMAQEARPCSNSLKLAPMELCPVNADRSLHPDARRRGGATGVPHGDRTRLGARY
jgi:hypothetical protein